MPGSFKDREDIGDSGTDRLRPGGIKVGQRLGVGLDTDQIDEFARGVSARLDEDPRIQLGSQHGLHVLSLPFQLLLSLFFQRLKKIRAQRVVVDSCPAHPHRSGRAGGVTHVGLNEGRARLQHARKGIQQLRVGPHQRVAGHLPADQSEMLTHARVRRHNLDIDQRALLVAHGRHYSAGTRGSLQEVGQPLLTADDLTRRR